jgi:hypothetical protein
MVCLPCYALVDTRKVSWTEVSTTMSMVDVLDTLDALNYITAQRNATREMSEDEYDQE